MISRTMKVCILGLMAIAMTAIVGITVMLPYGPASAAPGETITSPPLAMPGFLFEPESTIDSLKTAAQWNELEQLLDNPYAIAPDLVTPGNDQGFPSYTTDPAQFERRRSYLPPGCSYDPTSGVPLCSDAVDRALGLPQLLVHPLNYNPTTGEEMRLINPDYAGGSFDITSNCACDPTGGTIPSLPPCTVPVVINGLPALGCDPVLTPTMISAGADRVEPGEPAIDYNGPHAPDTIVCIITTETIPPEGSVLCGGDSGEPGFAGLGLPAVFPSATAYSTPAVPGVLTAATYINPAVDRLYDPTPDPVTMLPRGMINPRDPITGEGGLNKPSLRVPAVGGTPAAPNYAANSAANLAPDPAALVPSNENDYIAGATFAEKQVARDMTAALGKALFWDMQVGSDGIQACASCHFHAGVDNRTRGQLNPNHLGINGNSAKFEINGKNRGNQDVTAGNFPFHKLANRDIPGEPLLNPNNVLSTTDDVMSSMGVVFNKFNDVKVGPRAFVPGTSPKVLKPDMGRFSPDPIPVFQDLRRVEPRNTPTIFQSAMNFDNFWDGRARHDFNGGSVFGASDPQAHVMVDMGDGTIQATRQIIRFSSLASLATGPALSNFEMSADGRNWPKIGKKLLQAGVTPLANQLVDTTDSVLGIYSNQGGSACASLPVEDRSGDGITASGKPGLCISYPAMIRQAFYAELWQNETMHLHGCYTDGRLGAHPNQCAPGTVAIPVFDPVSGTVVDSAADPFDNYVLSIASGPSNSLNTNQFTQMESNMSLFFGLAVQTWAQILIPDDTGFDQMLDMNPDAFLGLGEAGEPLLVGDQLNCATPGVRNAPTPGNSIGACYTEVGNFKRDAGLYARTNPLGEGGAGSTVTPVSGTRQPGQPDPLLGTDLFHGTNLSLKNPNFRSVRCGACHLGSFLTDNNIERTHALSLGDFVAEFVVPGIEKILEPLGRSRNITGFLLESELAENGQDAIERFIGSQSLIVNPTDGLSYPDGAFFLDNGVYNLGVTPTDNDISRGGDDPFGWPLSLATLMMKNLAGPDFVPGTVMANFDPAIDVGGGLFEPTAQDQSINPGLSADDIVDPLLPPHLAPWTNRLNVGNAHPEMDEVFGGLNTLTQADILEGFVDTYGPFNPAGVLNEALNSSAAPLMGTWATWCAADPTAFGCVNRVGRMGNFKAPQLRNIELMGPYFHNGGKLTLRQVIDFYDRGGDFPVTNGGGVPCDATHTVPHPSNPAVCYDAATAHRDMMILNLGDDIQALGQLDPVGSGDPAVAPYPDGFTQEEALVALVDYLIELTDSRVKFEQAPFDHPEVFVPINGTAPRNTFGRESRPGRKGLVDRAKFRQIPAVGAAGNAMPLGNFMDVSSLRRTDPGFPAGAISHYDSDTGFADLTLISPNGGETFTGGGPAVTISWAGPAGADHYRLEFSRNGGATWEMIAGGIPGTTFSYDWTPVNPNNDRPDCLIKVIAKRAGGSIIERDKSNAPFTLLHTP